MRASPRPASASCTAKTFQDPREAPTSGASSWRTPMRPTTTGGRLRGEKISLAHCAGSESPTSSAGRLSTTTSAQSGGGWSRRARDVNAGAVSTVMTSPYGAVCADTIRYRMDVRTRKTLTRQDWAAAGLAALVEGGPDAVAVEPVATRLGATKGSGYWHFTDRAD